VKYFARLAGLKCSDIFNDSIITTFLLSLKVNISRISSSAGVASAAQLSEEFIRNASNRQITSKE